MKKKIKKLFQIESRRKPHTSMPATPNATAPIMLPEVPIKSLRARLQPVWNEVNCVHPAALPAQHEFGMENPHSSALFRPQHCS